MVANPIPQLEEISVPDRARTLLQQSPLLSELEPEELDVLASSMVWWFCPRESRLMDEGDEAETAFVVVRGRFEAHSSDALYNTLVPGDLIGETALLGGLTRNATVTAGRDSVVAAIGKDDLLALASTRPEILLAVTRLVARRWVDRSDQRRSHRPPGLVVVVPLTYATDVDGLAAEIALGVTSGSFVNGSELHDWLDDGGIERVVDETSRLEQQTPLVVVPVQLDALPSAVSPAALLRQADLVVGVVDANAAVVRRHVAVVRESRRPIRLLELRTPGTSAPAVSIGDPVLESLGEVPPLHVTRGSTSDVLRVARRLEGSSIGVVLGGGGARGFAHIGVLAALSEYGIGLDLVGGASMGAVMGAQFAMGWAPERMIRENAGRWTRRRLLDPRLPRTSLLRGESARGLLQSFYGDRTIESLPIEFFCVTSDISAYAPHIARRGDLTDWVAASAAVPGVWPPIADARGHLHVDGGLLNNVPTDVMAATHHGPVIGVELSVGDEELTVERADPSGQPSWYWRPNRGEPGILGLLGRAQQLASLQTQSQASAHADLYLSIDVSRFRFTDFESVEQIAEIGYEETRRQLESLPESGFHRVLGSPVERSADARRDR